MTIKTRELDVCILAGGGHVGLPLSLALAETGLNIGIFDTNAATVAAIASGEMPFMEAGAEALLSDVLAAGRLDVSADPDILRRSGQIIVVIGTPVDEFWNPSISVFQETVDLLTPLLRSGVLIMLRSTVYPGTTRFMAEALAERGLRADLAFCPERIAEGHALDELKTLPQIIGADTDRAFDRAAAVFGRLAPIIVRATTKEAELAKLFTNSWRYLKFAVANQFFMIGHQAGVDYDKVLNAIRDDYPRAADLPGPGFAAGPSLLKDTMQLAAFTSDHFQMGQSAMQINEGLPAYIVHAMERRYGSLHGRTVGILGMAFKPESDDSRASLSYKLRKLLAWAGARVICTDPYVVDDRLVTLEAALQESEILVLGVPHRVYQGLDARGKDVVDVWGALGSGIRV